MLCEYRDSSIQTYYMECNRHTMPVVTYIEEREFPFPVEKSDEKFLEIATQLCENRMVSSVYLIGEQPVQQGCLLQHDGATASQ